MTSEQVKIALEAIAQRQQERAYGVLVEECAADIAAVQAQISAVYDDAFKRPNGRRYRAKAAKKIDDLARLEMRLRREMKFLSQLVASEENRRRAAYFLTPSARAVYEVGGDERIERLHAFVDLISGAAPPLTNEAAARWPDDVRRLTTRNFDVSCRNQRRSARKKKRKPSR